MFSLFDKFKKTVKSALEPISLFTSLNDDNAISSDEYLSELINATGKSKSQLLSTILSDDEVNACVEDILSAMLATPIKIYGDDLDEDNQNKLLDWLRPRLPIFAHLALTAKLNGYILAEYIYTNQNGIFWIDKILSLDDKLHEFEIKRNGDVFYHFNTPIDKALKVLLLQSRATPANPYGQMLALQCYPAVALRKKAFAYTGQFIIRYAQPFIIGKQTVLNLLGDEDNNPLNIFARKLYQFANGGAVAIGKDDDVQITQLTANGDAFELVERLCNRRIQKILLGKVKTSELTNGSRSAQETDDLARLDRLGAYLALMKTAIQHAIDAMATVNGWEKPIWFEFELPKAVDKTRAERDKLYLDTGTMAFTKDYYKDIVGLEEHHFKMIEPTQNLSNAMLSLQLSDDGNQNDKLLTEQKIASDRAGAVLALLNECDDFAEFADKLGGVVFDDSLANEVFKQNLTAYQQGLKDD